MVTAQNMGLIILNLFFHLRVCAATRKWFSRLKNPLASDNPAVQLCITNMSLALREVLTFDVPGGSKFINRTHRLI